MNNFFIISFVVLFLTSCIRSEQFFEEQNFLISTSTNYRLQLNSGTVIPLDTLDNEILYSVIFSAVEGGESKLLGLWRISEGNGYSSKRLKVVSSEQKAFVFSIDDLIKLNSDTINLADILSTNH